MGGASPYRARFIGGQAAGDGDEVPCDGGEKYFGLVNVKNTCYVNSVLQALFFCTSFRRSAIRHLDDDRDDEPGSESLLTSLGELFAQIEGQKKNVGCLTPRRFLARLRQANDLFCNSEHQDAHEFLQFLLNDIVENAKKRVKRKRDRERAEAISSGALTNGGGAHVNGTSSEQSEDEPRTWVHDILQGYLVNQMKCLCCENVTVRRETFFDLSVDIEQQTSIAACLRAFESTERLRSTNKFSCDTCGCLQEAEKRLRIYQLPSVLTLHLKRFKYDERLGRCCRLPYRVVFPLQLRVDEHRPPRRQGQPGPPEAAPPPPDGNSSHEADGEESHSSGSSRLFELRSVVVHIGRDLSYGHYVTVVRNGDRCVLLDDDVVRVVGPEILRSFYGSAGNGNPSSNYHGHDRHNNHNNSGGEPAPYYERAPEGTCCGYLLIYEAVDGTTEQNGSAVDLGSAADWISEDHNFSDSESGESTEERPPASQQSGGRHPNACDDELTQTFEQRCGAALPNGRVAPATPLSSAGASAGPVANGAAGAAGAAAATVPNTTPVADQRGRERTLGSVVPAAGSADAVSLSRVNVVTVPSPAVSLEGGSTPPPERG